MAIYINGIGSISPQETRDNSSFLKEVNEYREDFLGIVEPPYKEYINPKDLRRMSKIIRHGIIAARISMEDSELDMPDAIYTGTGLGCVVDTEKFLLKMIENKETLLTPTNFIQSTHNTIGGSIAIGLGCHNYNMTYVNRGFSFETALLDSIMMLQDGEIKNALVGGFDEMTDNHIVLLRSTGNYQAKGFSNLDLKNPEKSGTMAGQGSNFFVLEKEMKPSSYAQIRDLKLIYKPESELELSKKIQAFLDKNKMNNQDIDLVLMGYNGLEAETKTYNTVREKLFPTNSIGWFKHLCGEYFTASSFGMWMAAQILQKQDVPEIIYHNQKKARNINNILVYNQFQGNEHSLFLFSAC
jgi:3-oxoacyl-(acyl-carrier-protein) synthase